jgi:serine/threonine protein kinase
MAPELVRGDPYDSKADIWALGPTLLYLLKGREPWYFLRPNQQGKRGKFSTLRETWCPYIKNDAQGEALGPEEMSFMREVMKEDPKARPTAEWLLANSSYLQGAG